MCACVRERERDRMDLHGAEKARVAAHEKVPDAGVAFLPAAA